MKKEFILYILLSVGLGGFAQDTSDSIHVPLATAITEPSFEFVPRQVFPIGMPIRQLNYSAFGLEINGDSMRCYLPYFGRAYSAIIDPSKAGLDFTSTDFTYKKKRYEDRWTVDINPGYKTGVHSMHFEIFDNGNSSLQVIPMNKQSIRYQGKVRSTANKK